MTRKWILAFLLAFCSLSAVYGFDTDSLGQRVAVHGRWCSPEKLYMHLDRTCYAAGETIWFKGYLSDAFPRSKQKGSGFIYVELLDSTGNAVLRHKIKRASGGFPGHMFLPEDIRGGDYVFRAYTLWQMNKSDEYMFNQRLAIVGARPVKPRKEPPLSDRTDVSFYPEGGRYFLDRQSVIGFKVMDGNGKSVEFSGVLCDESGNTLMRVESDFDGMGSFSFVPREGHSYFLCSGKDRKYPLPEVSTQGASLYLKDSCGVLSVRVEGCGEGQYALMSMVGSDLNLISGVSLDGGTRVFGLDPSRVRPGVNHLLLLDINGHIVSERKFFVYTDNTATCVLDSVRISHDRCKPVSAVLKLNGADGRPLGGTCSVSVLRSAFKKHHQADGIESFMALSSELEGHINDPGHYFDDTVPLQVRKRDMDLLMMIQGWNYYDIEQITSSSEPFNVRFLREYSQKLTGKILSGRRNKMPKDFSFILIIPDLKFTRMIEVASADTYVIDDIPFPENTRFLVGINRKGIGRDYIPRWTGDKVAHPYVYSREPGRRTDISEDFLPAVYEGVVVDTLAAAVVTASVDDDDPFAHGMNGRVISQDELKDFRDYTLVQYVLYRTPRFEYNGDYMYNRNFLRASGAGKEQDPVESVGTDDGDGSSGRGKVKLLDEGVETEWWTYESLSVSDIGYLNISTDSDPVHNADGGVVAIKVRPGVNLDADVNESVLCFVPLGYQKPSAFYSPRYDKGDSHEVYDHRNTIYWNPEVKFTGGRAQMEFCDTDQQDYPYYVRIEGVTEDGTPFSGRAVIE